MIRITAGAALSGEIAETGREFHAPNMSAAPEGAAL